MKRGDLVDLDAVFDRLLSSKKETRMSTKEDPYRAPDPVLLLETQLSQARQDLETMRAELVEERAKREKVEKEQLRAKTSPDARDARTFRIAIVCLTSIVLSIVWGVFKYNMSELNQPEGACHDVVFSDTVNEKKCPHSAQKLTVQDGKLLCDCPRGAP